MGKGELKKKIKALRRKSKTYWRNKCDKLARELTLRDAGYKCERCGEKGSLHWHHVVTRRLLKLRYDPLNNMALCSGCHKLRTDSAHENPFLFREWFKKKYGEARYWYLVRESNDVQPLPFDFYEGEWAKLREREGKNEQY